MPDFYLRGLGTDSYKIALDSSLATIAKTGQLSSATTDSTHRTVTDSEKSTWNGKQAALVSGSNIKTVNGNTLLGSGNLQLSGLPEVTATDNGCILKVVNGVWTVVATNPPTLLSITNPPTKTSYNESEVFDPAGMVVQVTYQDGTVETITNYSYPTSALTPSMTSVEISFTDQRTTVTANQSITVAGVSYTVTTTAQSGITYTEGVPSDYTTLRKIAVATADVSTIDENTGEIYANANNGTGYHISVGDTLPVTLNGTLGSVAYDNTVVYPYVVGFNHNRTNNQGLGIYFQFFKTSEGTYSAFVDSKYATSVSTCDVYYNNVQDQYGDWITGNVRMNILGSSDVSGGSATTAAKTSPASNTLMSILPSGLRSILSPIKAFAGKSASDMTSYLDYLPLAAQTELSGLNASTSGAMLGAEPAAIAAYERQFKLYLGTYGVQRYGYPTQTSTSIRHWNRSYNFLLTQWENIYDTSYSTVLGIGENVQGMNNRYSYGLAPIFLIGPES